MNARAQALAQGLKTYQGAACKHGHGGERYTSTGACIACMAERMRRQYVAKTDQVLERNRKWVAANPEWQREYARRRYAANPERALERIRLWQLANSEHCRAQNRKWYAANAEHHHELMRQWKRDNPGAVRAIAAKRRALQLAQRCTCCSDADIQKIYDIAALCGPAAHVDHVRALALGGLHCSKNLVAITAEDHIEKTSKRDAGLIAAARRERAATAA